MSTLHIRELAARAQFTLGLTHDEMARMTGVSLRTAQRWAAGHSEPATFQLARVIPALYARDRELAAEIVKAVGTTFERLGIEPADAKPAPPPPALVPLLAAASVAAAADVVQLPPSAVRPALSAAARVALQAGLDLTTLAAALDAPPAARPARPASNGAHGSKR